MHQDKSERMAEIDGEYKSELVPLTLDSSTNEHIKHILEGLNAIPKYLPLPNSYFDLDTQLIDKELQIVNQEIDHLVKVIGSPKGIKMVDLHIESHRQVEPIIASFIGRKSSFEYIPIDSSRHRLTYYIDNLWNKYKGITIYPLTGEGLEILEDLKVDKGTPKVVLCLGGFICDISFEQAVDFIQRLSKSINRGDLVVCSFDLKRDPEKVHKAFDQFCKAEQFTFGDYLRDTNQLLSGNFNPSTFKYHSSYDAETGECKSYLVSLIDQTVTFSHINSTIVFKEWETILMKSTKKYSEEEITFLEICSGLSPKAYLFDEKHHFLIAIWQKNY